MTLDELSIQFDLLYNNISSNQAPGLTEYEKSVFLTQAQEAVILDLYKGVTGDSFETTEEVTRYLSSLVLEASLNSDESMNKPIIKGVEGTTYILPTDLWFVTFQSGSITVDNNDRDVIVVPTIQDSLYNTLNNPFKGPHKNRVLSVSDEGGLTIYSKYPIKDIYIKYLSRPKPIILANEGFTINGETESTQIDWLPESLHNQILVRAVQIAKSVWAS
jgi:hypothetical protein